MEETTRTTNGQRGSAVSDWINVGEPERWGSVGAGAALAIFGMRRGGVPGALLVLSGGGLVLRGMTGHCYAYEAMGMSTAESGGFGEMSRSDDPGSRAQAFELRATEDRISGRPVDATEPWAGEERGTTSPE